VKRAKYRSLPSDEYIEKHHIKPRCIRPEFVRSQWNIVRLTAREHFIAHWLLVKIYQNNYKLASAFNNMCRTPNGADGERSKYSRFYAIARRHFSENHPNKNPDVRSKISAGVKEYMKNNPNRGNEISISLKEYWYNKKNNPDYPPALEYKVLCECGCGEEMVFARPTDFKRFKPGHHKLSLERKKIQSENQRKYMANRSAEEKAAARAKGIKNTDQIQRGKAISAAKFGKKTNQQEIMGKRYSAMTDDEFEEYLTTIKPMAKTRATNLRNRYNGLS
jgi:hypothetical protein